MIAFYMNLFLTKIIASKARFSTEFVLMFKHCSLRFLLSLFEWILMKHVLYINLLHCSKILHFLVYSITFPQAHICYCTGMHFWLYQFAPILNMNQLLDQSLLVGSIKRLLGGTETKSLYHPKELVSIKHLPY